MSVSIAYAREMVATKSRYKNSPNWQDKVYRMPEGQVLAIYHNMLNRGEFNQKVKSYEEVTENKYHQETLFEHGLEVDDEAR